MDLDYSDEDKAFREDVRSYLAENLDPETARKSKEGGTHTKAEIEAWHAILAKRNWLAHSWPKAMGGAEFTPVQKHIFEEERVAAGGPEIVPFGVNMLGPVILAFGSDEQKQTVLPRILNGEDWWCQGYSEPGSGSDLASLKTTAVRDGDHYVVNGQKTWTTLGQHANKIFSLVRTSKEGKPQEGISFLLMDMDAEGVSIRPIRTLDGGLEVNEVFFDDVRVPVENLVGEENKGWTYAKYLLMHERTGIAGVPQAKEDLKKVTKIAAETEGEEGEPLLDDPFFAARLAQTEIDLMAMELTNLRVLSEAQKGGAPGVESSLIKIKGTQIRQELTDLARRAVGPYAMPYTPEVLETGSNEEPVGPRHAISTAPKYFNYRKISIYGGSNEIQRNIITKMMLGLKGVKCDMDFELSEDHKLIKDTINRFMRDDYGFETRLKFVESGEGSSEAVWGQIAELGLLAAALPEEAGGLGGTGLDIAVVMEEFGRGILAEPYIPTAILGAGVLADIGGHEALLESVIGGETKLALAHFEPGARYNPTKVATAATASNDGYTLSGAKSVVAGGGQADHLLVTAKVDGETAVFLVPADADGLDIRDYPTQDGSHAAELALDDVTLGAGALLARGAAADAAVDAALARGLLAVGAEAVGAMEAARDLTLDYLKTRTQFGVPIGKFQALQHRMVDLCIEIEQARSLVMLAADRLHDSAVERDKALSAMKVKVGQAGRLVSEESIQMHGGIGVTWEYALGHIAKRLTMIDHSFGDVDYHLRRFVKLKQAA